MESNAAPEADLPSPQEYPEMITENDVVAAPNGDEGTKSDTDGIDEDLDF